MKLAGVAMPTADTDRLRSVNLDGPALVKAMERAPIAVPLGASELKNLLPELARSLSDDRVTVSANVTDARPTIAGLRGGDVRRCVPAMCRSRRAAQTAHIKA